MMGGVMRIWTLVAVLTALAAPALALSERALRDDGYRALDCVFTERCLIGQPCTRSFRQIRWWLSDADARAYQVGRGGDLTRGILSLDTRWKDLSKARSILMPMREQVASHLTVFHSGGAIYSVQYAADPGSGAFLRGTCERGDTQ